MVRIVRRASRLIFCECSMLSIMDILMMLFAGEVARVPYYGGEDCAQGIKVDILGMLYVVDDGHLVRMC